MLLKADVPPAPRWTIGQEGEHQIAHQGSAKVLFYLGFDLAFALAKLPDTELVLRIQHRSGAIADDDRPFTTRGRTLSATTSTWINGPHAVFIKRLEAVRPSERMLT
jgi:hypothetical protein